MVTVATYLAIHFIHDKAELLTVGRRRYESRLVWQILCSNHARQLECALVHQLKALVRIRNHHVIAHRTLPGGGANPFCWSSNSCFASRKSAAIISFTRSTNVVLGDQFS